MCGNNTSSQMEQPGWLKGRQHRRDGVVVDGDQAWQFFCAAADGDGKAISELLAKDPNLAHAQIWYQKPIDVAIRENHLEAVKLILDADTNQSFGGWIYSGNCYRMNQDEVLRRGYVELDEYLMNYKRTLAPNYREEFDPVAEAINSGDSQAAKQLLDEDETLVHASDLHGFTAAHLAVKNKSLDLLLFLLSKNADMEIRTSDRRRPIDLAIREFLPAASFLLAHGSPANLEVLTALGITEGVAPILDMYPDAANRVDANGMRLLTYAARYQHADLVELLLEKKADPNLPERDAADGRALFEACGNWDTKIVEMLLEAGANPNAEIDSSGCCLSQLVDHEKWQNQLAQEITELLRNHGAVDPPWSHSAEQQLELLDHDELSSIQRDWDSGWADFPNHIASIDVLDKFVQRLGDQPIKHLAYDSVPINRPEIVNRMLEHGLDPNRRDWQGRTALHACAESGSTETAELLLRHQANVEAKDVRFKTTPLGYAARTGQIEMVRWLLEKGAQREPQAENDWASPLAYAQLNGSEECIAAIQ